MGETLPHAFLQHLKTNPEIIESIREFQVGYRSYFMADAASDDFTQEMRSAYLEFVKLIDSAVANFLAIYGATEEDFVAGLKWMEATQDPHWHAYNMCLQKIEFEEFVSMLRSDICLCCGRSLCSPGHALPTSSPPLEPTPQLQQPLGDEGVPPPPPPPPPEEL
eukprot:TRINITY_DN33138_c0_g1_i2.p1 TRINITY_DN33138_c0_g1~~TRINITY_DN33138_c0_g1_i2.p1  ORF type:complete len:164 (-),score=36.31 TRINITY_DN33138_c0_g1_i2:133-624(-)